MVACKCGIDERDCTYHRPTLTLKPGPEQDTTFLREESAATYEWTVISYGRLSATYEWTVIPYGRLSATVTIVL